MEPSSSWRSEVILFWSKRHVGLTWFSLYPAASQPWGTPHVQVPAQACSGQCHSLSSLQGMAWE